MLALSHNYDYQNIDHLLWPDDVFETPHAENETCIQFERRPEEAQNLVQIKTSGMINLDPKAFHVVIWMADFPYSYSIYSTSYSERIWCFAYIMTTESAKSNQWIWLQILLGTSQKTNVYRNEDLKPSLKTIYILILFTFCTFLRLEYDSCMVTYPFLYPCHPPFHMGRGGCGRWLPIDIWYAYHLYVLSVVSPIYILFTLP